MPLRSWNPLGITLVSILSYCWKPLECRFTRIKISSNRAIWCSQNRCSKSELILFAMSVHCWVEHHRDYHLIELLTAFQVVLHLHCNAIQQTSWMQNCSCHALIIYWLASIMHAQDQQDRSHINGISVYVLLYPCAVWGNYLGGTCSLSLDGSTVSKWNCENAQVQLIQMNKHGQSFGSLAEAKWTNVVDWWDAI